MDFILDRWEFKHVAAGFRKLTITTLAEEDGLVSTAKESRLRGVAKAWLMPNQRGGKGGEPVRAGDVCKVCKVAEIEEDVEMRVGLAKASGLADNVSYNVHRSLARILVLVLTPLHRLLAELVSVDSIWGIADDAGKCSVGEGLHNLNAIPLEDV